MMAIEKLILEKNAEGLSSVEEIPDVSWEKVRQNLEAIKGREGESLVLFRDLKDERSFLKIMAGPGSFRLLYTYTESTLPDVMRNSEESADPDKVQNAIWIVDGKGAEDAAKEYFERGCLYDSVEWEMV